MRDTSARPPTVEAQAFIRTALRTDFISFIRKCFGILSPDTAYLANWHIEAIAWKLDQVRRGAIRRLIITIPPRSLKSVSASVALPAFIHGHDPTREIICVSYAQDLAAKLHNDYRTVLRSDWYRQAFPDTCISAHKDTENETLLTARGTRMATSVGGVLTGRGGHFIIIDDPLKPADAMSEPKRKAVNDWFGQSLATRLNDKQRDAIVIVTQRLHCDDLIGHLFEADPEGWTVLNLPAIAPRDGRVQIAPQRFHEVKEGDVLHPEREPLEVLNQVRRDLGSDNYKAQYLQTPVPSGGNMFKRIWIEYYDQAPLVNGDDEIIQSWDTAAKTGLENDWSVCTTWLVQHGRYYLLNVFRDRLNYPMLRSKAIELGRRYDPRMILVEDTTVGTPLATELKARGLKARPIKVAQAKEARAAVEAAKFEGGLVVFPSRASWLAELEAELFAFPGGRHDDQVDSITQALAYDLNARRGGSRPVRGHI